MCFATVNISHMLIKECNFILTGDTIKHCRIIVKLVFMSGFDLAKFYLGNKNKYTL